MLVSRLVFEVDTSQVDVALEKINSLKQAHGGFEFVPGQAAEFVIDPLESAIGSTVQLIADERDRLEQAGLPNGQLIGVLGEHLDRLLDVQIRRVTGPADDHAIADGLTRSYGLRRRGS